MDIRQKKLSSPKGDALEGEVWIGISFAKEYRMMVSFMIDTKESYLAEPLIAKTEERLREDGLPVWVSDGFDSYGEVLKGRHCILERYPRTGKRGRPRRPKILVHPDLQYAQVVKQRDGRGRVVGVVKRSIYGGVSLEMISTAYVERHNLTLRQENRRLTRKTVAFSKKLEGLRAQMSLHQGYFNFVRPHRSLRCLIPSHEQGIRKWRLVTPAMAAALTDHIWSLKELMSFKYYHGIRGS